MIFIYLILPLSSIRGMRFSIRFATLKMAVSGHGTHNGYKSIIFIWQGGATFELE